jgi:hypothetical protein
MVNPRPRARRGASTVGCLVWLIITLVVLYYGANIGKIWWRYYELVDRMKTAARFAGVQTNDQILRQLQTDAREIGVPAEATRFKIARTEVPRSITITTEYRERVDLPLVHRTFAFRPSVNQRL